MRSETHTVPPLTKPIRLSDYAGGKFLAIPSRKGMKKAIDKGWVYIDGEPAITGRLLNGGEILSLRPPDPDSIKPVFEQKLEVLLEDEHLAVVLKPAGLEVSGNRFRTLENALPFNLSASNEADALLYPMAAHRLDFPTSGLIVIGKTHKAIHALNKLFEERKIQKTYIAIASGKTPDDGIITSPIDSKDAHTEYKTLNVQESKKYGALSLLRVHLMTGRKHQIRIHLAEIGHPILGDQTYGVKGKITYNKGLYLHALKLSFQHPLSGIDLTINSGIPRKFEKIFGKVKA